MSFKAFLVKKTLFYLLVPCLIALCSIILHSIIILLLCIPLDILCVSNTAKLVMLSDILESSLSKSIRFFVNLTVEICAMFLRALGGAVSRLSPVALLFWWEYLDHLDAFYLAALHTDSLYLFIVSVKAMAVTMAIISHTKTTTSFALCLNIKESSV